MKFLERTFPIRIADCDVNNHWRPSAILTELQETATLHSAAIGCGLYASVLLGANPKKEAGWATANRFTAACLARVASVEGPRCCKRVTYLALEEACALSGGLLGVPLPADRAVCSRFALNRECRGEGCPFHPAAAKP